MAEDGGKVGCSALDKTLRLLSAMRTRAPQKKRVEGWRRSCCLLHLMLIRVMGGSMRAGEREGRGGLGRRGEAIWVGGGREGRGGGGGGERRQVDGEVDRVGAG